jgi:hypothetical protein
MQRITLDGHTYTKADVEQIRQQVIGWRVYAMNQGPGAIPFTLAASHLIGLLAGVVDQYPEDEEIKAGNRARDKATSLVGVVLGVVGSTARFAPEGKLACLVPVSQLEPLV